MAKASKSTKKPVKADDKPAAAATPAAAPAGPSFNILGQYIKDLSFENPAAPSSNLLGGGQPDFAVSINVNAKKQSDDVYAVELTINAKAERDKTVMFNVELVYGGLFRVQNVPENQLPALLMIECPRMLFPFARQILSNVTQAGGFPPLLMEPVDFVAIYQQNLQQAAQASQATNGTTKPN